MLNLIIDTATKWIYISIIKDDTVVATSKFQSENSHSADFLYVLDMMFRANDLVMNDIQRIYVGVGPGSYTGERIGVTVGKMFSSFKEIALYKVSSLFIAGSGYKNKNVSVMFDARRGNVFCANYGQNEIVDKLRSQEEFMAMINDFADLKVVTEDDYNPDPFAIIDKGELVLDVDSLVPNYLRISEAEYNLMKNDKKS